MGRLDQADLTAQLSKRDGEQRLEVAQERLLRLRLQLGGQIGERGLGPPLCVLSEGLDASGKGGAIKRLVEPLDPRHVRVVQFAAPTYDEKRHHFLWRFWPVLPGWGGMSVDEHHPLRGQRRLEADRSRRTHAATARHWRSPSTRSTSTRPYHDRSRTNAGATTRTRPGS